MTSLYKSNKKKSNKKKSNKKKTNKKKTNKKKKQYKNKKQQYILYVVYCCRCYCYIDNMFVIYDNISLGSEIIIT